MPGKGVVYACRHARPNPFLIAACPHLGRFGIPKRDPDRDRLLAFSLDLLNPRWVSFGKMQTSVDQYVDAFLRGLEQGEPQRAGDGASFRYRR